MVVLDDKPESSRPSALRRWTSILAGVSAALLAKIGQLIPDAWLEALKSLVAGLEGPLCTRAVDYYHADRAARRCCGIRIHGAALAIRDTAAFGGDCA